jgi:hypothetical protein
MGADLGIDRSTDPKEQLEAQKEKYLKFTTEQRDVMDKCRSLQQVNKQLSEVNHKLLRSINDVTQLLNMYVEFFEVVKQQTQQLSKDIQTGMSPSDFDYIKNLTTEHMMALSDEFRKSVSDLRSMYTEYNMQSELDNINATEQSLEVTVKLADEFYPKLTTQTATPPPAPAPAPAPAPTPSPTPTPTPTPAPARGNANASRNVREVNANANAPPVFSGFSAASSANATANANAAGNANAGRGRGGRFGGDRGRGGRGRGRNASSSSASPGLRPSIFGA